MTEQWAEKMHLFCRSPTNFLSASGTTAETLLAELVRELREDRAPAHVKVLLLSPFCEQPLVLCPSQSVGEETALELMSVYSQCSPKALPLRCHLLLAITSVLLCTNCVRRHSNATQDFLDLLFLIVQDTSELHSDSTSRSWRATACDCLRELEACCPGLLSQHLELLGALRQRESSRLHQAYCELYTLVMRNGVYQLAQDRGAGPDHLKALLEGDTSVASEVTQDSNLMNSKDLSALSSLVLGPMGAVPTLHTGPDCKELRSVLSSLLEDSYLLTPLAQAALLHKLIELVAMVPGVPPTIFRAQLLRLLGTTEVSLLHTTLLMKSAFTDSLFSAEDEAFLLKRLVVLSQHPLLSTPEKLFYMDCLLHFPENRPIGSGDGDETLPVLLTPQLASALVPTVFNDSVTMLTRFNLMSMVYLENGEGEDEEGRGLAYMYEHLVTLLGIVGNRGHHEIVTTFFRASFLFLSYFGHAENYSSHLIKRLCELYLDHTHLAPQLINLADETQDKLSDSSWTVALLQGFQSTITNVSLTKITSRDLNCHLKMMARVAEERDIPQHSTLLFLSAVVMASSSSLLGNWQLGNGILAVCRCLLTHPGLDTLLVTLADVLQHMATSYRDTDIRDHSRLYYTLLTNLSKEKLAGVLERGTATEKDQVKKRTLSCIVAESEGQASILAIQRMEKEVLKLVELRMIEPRQLSDVQDGPCDSIEAMAEYRAQFDSPDFATEVTINYQLVHSDKNVSHFDHLFSICLHLSLTDEHYEELGDISVPCLFREKPPPIVKLKLKPRQPYPTSLLASALFTTQDGLTWYSELPEIHISFQQTFCPVPVPPAWGQPDKLHLFNALWQQICTECEDVVESAKSLFCCQLQKEELETLVDKHFKPFLVEDDSDQDELRVLVFLPPLSHMLFKIRREEDAVNFDIATDNWHFLPHINSFLQEVTSQGQSLR
ncbi:AP-5 complex subunit beta-1 [Eucyclogobius newberryi]|uniref:AP-5 complex subunit beta-1 n=1 Tax=Eucyclogobius newberryi TaxID=166745 RepID=UPI003B5AD482